MSAPDLLTPERAVIGMLKRGLTVLSETPGAWDALPDGARRIFLDAMFAYPDPVTVVQRMAEERDDAVAFRERVVKVLDLVPAGPLRKEIGEALRSASPTPSQHQEGRSE